MKGWCLLFELSAFFYTPIGGSDWLVICLFLFRHVTLLTNLIQSPELNSSNPAPVVKDAEQRILRCYFRDLCRIYLGN